jgi:hydrogenase maturation protease
MTPPWAVVIGVGNELRHDDRIGPAVATDVQHRNLPGVRVVISDGEPIGLLDAWAGVRLAVVIDAVVCEPSTPGRCHRTIVDELPPATGTASTHGFGIPDAVQLARVLDRMPPQLIVYVVEVLDVSLGQGLSSPVAASCTMRCRVESSSSPAPTATTASSRPCSRSLRLGGGPSW